MIGSCVQSVDTILFFFFFFWKVCGNNLMPTNIGNKEVKKFGLDKREVLVIHYFHFSFISEWISFSNLYLLVFLFHWKIIIRAGWMQKTIPTNKDSNSTKLNEDRFQISTSPCNACNTSFLIVQTLGAIRFMIISPQRIKKDPPISFLILYDKA